MVEPISLFFVLDIDECQDKLHNCSSDESCVNQIGSFTCFPDSTACNGSESSQLNGKAIGEYKVTIAIKNNAIETSFLMFKINYILDYLFSLIFKSFIFFFIIRLQ